jgi:hypothetical protein
VEHFAHVDPEREQLRTRSLDVGDDQKQPLRGSGAVEVRLVPK